MPNEEATRTLGDLPASAMDEILARLPIKEAGRTSILSRSWRHRWRSIPDLDLSSLSDPLLISQVLLLHDGLLRLFKAQSQRPLPILSCWLSSLSRHSSSTLRSLSLTAALDSAVLSLNSLSSYFPNLTHLCLKYCSFPPSPSPASSKGFPNLYSLCIEVKGSHALDISSLISGCPLLEELILTRLHMWDDSLVIIAPNLRRLELSGLEPGSFSVANAPLVETAIIEFDDSSGEFFLGNSNMADVVGKMASLTKLVLDGYILTSWTEDLMGSMGCIPMRVPVSLDHLKFLSLQIDFIYHPVVQFTPCLLRSCPNLEELEIKGFCYDLEPPHHIGEEFWKAQEHIDALDRLKTVKMTMMSGMKNELDLMQFMLARALRLKTMMIDLYENSMKEIAMTRLLKFPRASHEARIILISEDEIVK